MRAGSRGHIGAPAPVADSLLGRAAIPARFADKRLDNFAPHAEAARALELARRYADGFGAEAAKSGASRCSAAASARARPIWPWASPIASWSRAASRSSPR